MAKKDAKLRTLQNEPKTREKTEKVSEKTNSDKGTNEAQTNLPERFTISSALLNDMIGILSILPAYQIMELITKVKMDLTLSPTREELDEFYRSKANKENEKTAS